MSSTESYDFIVVGTGSGGGTMIARLVVAGFSVLALEAGVDFTTSTDRRKESTQITADEELEYDWPYLAEAEITGYGFAVPESDQSMGRMVGGSGHHFGYICYRGTPEDYKEWDYLLIDGGTVAVDGVGRLTGTCTFGAFPTVTGTATLWAGVAATGSITTIAKASLVDGETFQLDDGVNPQVTFQFDVTGAAIITPGNVSVDVTADVTADDVRDTIIAVIAGLADFDITAASGGAATVSLTNDLAGPGVTNATLGNTTSSDTVVDVAFVVTNMTGATDSELAVGDYIQSTEQAAWPFGPWPLQPLQVAAIASATSLTLTPDPLGGANPAGGVGTVVVKNTIWNESRMTEMYKAIENDIDFGGDNSPTPYGPANVAAHGANSGPGVTHIGRVGAQRVPGSSAPPGTYGDTRANVTSPRIHPIQVKAMAQLVNATLGGPAFTWIDDRNNGLKPPSRNVHKYPKNEIGFDNDGVPVAGGFQTGGIFHLNKYDERRSQLIVAIDPVRGYPNFTLVANATVDKVLIEDNVGAPGDFGAEGLMATGVEYIQLAADGTETRKTALAPNVILSAGPFGTPCVLLRSGIGDDDRLAPHGIPKLVDLPGVGADCLQHTISVGNVYIMNQEFDLIRSSGPFGSQFASRYTQPVTATPEGPRAKFAVGTPPVLFDSDPDIQVFIGGGAGSENSPLLGPLSHGAGAKAAATAYGNAYAVVAAGFKPRSRGDGVRLRSTNPFDVPIIHDGRLSDPDSLEAEAFLDFFQVIDAKMTEAGGGLVFQPDISFVVPIPTTIEQVCSITTGAFHVVSTAKMGVPTNPRAVCDRYGRILGVKGLACCDNSIYPTHTRANPHWPTVAHAWNQAEVFIANNGLDF